MSFDSKAQEWDKNPVRVKRAEIFGREIRNFLPEGKMEKALEFGSGTGLLSEQLKDRFETIVLVDTSEGMHETLKQKIKAKKLDNFRPYKIDITQQTFPEKDFDMVYTLMTLHHIRDTAHILNIFNSLLKPGGYLCIADLDKEDGSFHGSSDFDGHYGFDRIALKKTLEKEGFKEVYYSTPVSIDKNIEGTEKKYPLFLMIAQKS